MISRKRTMNSMKRKHSLGPYKKRPKWVDNQKKNLLNLHIACKIQDLLIVRILEIKATLPSQAG